MTKTNETNAVIAARAAEANKRVKGIVKATEQSDVLYGKAADLKRAAVQAVVDWAATAYGRDELGTKAFQADLKASETFANAVATGLLEAKTVTEYMQGMARAHFHAVPWAPTLKNDPDCKLPWGRKSAPADKAPGKVEVSNPLEDARAHFALTLEFLRKANCTDLAADLLDRMLETFPDFKE